MEKVVIELFDRQKAISKFGVPCIKCPIHKMIEHGVRGPGKGNSYCMILEKDCPWVTHSTRTGGLMNIAPSSKSFKDCGFKLINDKSTYKIGKCHFLFFLYHPDMNWEPPQERPERNRFGKIIQPNDIWELCHINGIFWDDSKTNLQWGWRSEHKVLEPNIRKKDEPRNLYEVGIPR